MTKVKGQMSKVGGAVRKLIIIVRVYRELFRPERLWGLLDPSRYNSGSPRVKSRGDKLEEYPKRHFPNSARVKRSAGFSLPEMLVAAALFSLVAAAASGIFLSAYRSQRSAYAFLGAHNNVRFALEAVAREIRTGAPPEEIAGMLVFENQLEKIVAYRLAGGRLEKCDGFLRDEGKCGGVFLPITAAGVVVEEFRFLIAGEAPGDGVQPRVTILLRISAQIAKQRAVGTLQTTITQRELDS